jgi:hypothetical protein
MRRVPRTSDGLRSRRSRRLAWLITALLMVAITGHAQQEEPVYTLHAYVKLVQVPVLVLDRWLQPLPPVGFNRFQVSLDSGKKFPPRRVRVEGDDPIDLAIVLDVSGPQKKLIEGLPPIAAEFATHSLHPQDHVSVYALTCNLVTMSDSIPTDPKAISSAMDSVIHSANLGRKADGTSCGKKRLLWNAMIAVINNLDKAAGRRVVLVVSDGDDNGSTFKWNDVYEHAVERGVALFGMNDGGADLTRRLMSQPDRLKALCESSGGIILHAESYTLAQTLDDWIALVRSRYVVEFPEPRRMSLGKHTIVVSIAGKSDVFITLSGVSVSLPDPQVMADPNTVHSDAGDDIPVGNRRPLQSGHH